MDTSKTYIKMCDCEELQGKWKALEGDSIYCTYCKKIHFFLGATDHIWLPRQDQLQEMVIGNTENSDKLGSLLSRFWIFCSCFYLGKLTFEVFVSMEQLWLAFVMKENRNKVWDGSVWK